VAVDPLRERKDIRPGPAALGSVRIPQYQTPAANTRATAP